MLVVGEPDVVTVSPPGKKLAVRSCTQGEAILNSGHQQGQDAGA